MKSLFNIITTFFVTITFLSCSESSDIETDFDDPEVLEANSIKFSGNVGGCGDFFIHVLESDQNTKRSLTISGFNKAALGLTTEDKEFQLPNTNLIIEITNWDRPVTDFFCNDFDIISPSQLISVWPVISGVAIINISDITPSQFPGLDYYKINISLNNVIFKDLSGEEIMLDNIDIQDVDVGWLPG